MQKNFFFKIVLKCLFKDSRIIIATAAINELNFQPVRNLNVTSTTNTKDARGADEPATGGSTVQTITRAVSTNDPPARPQSTPSGERAAVRNGSIALLPATTDAKNVHCEHGDERSAGRHHGDPDGSAGAPSVHPRLVLDGRGGNVSDWSAVL